MNEKYFPSFEKSAYPDSQSRHVVNLNFNAPVYIMQASSTAELKSFSSEKDVGQNFSSLACLVSDISRFPPKIHQTSVCVTRHVCSMTGEPWIEQL